MKITETIASIKNIVIPSSSTISRVKSAVAHLRLHPKRNIALFTIGSIIFASAINQAVDGAQDRGSMNAADKLAIGASSTCLALNLIGLTATVAALLTRK